MQPLTGVQRKYLKKMAHDLKPVAFVGKQGLTPEVVDSVEQTFTTHELIKVKFLDYKDQKRELAETLEAETRSTLVFIIGNIAIFYREHNDREKRQYILP